MRIKQIQDQAHRSLIARFGEDYVYRAPETFQNVLERWIWALAADSAGMAEQCIKSIEEALAETS